MRRVAWDLEIGIPTAYTPAEWETVMVARGASDERYDIFDDWPFGVTVGAASESCDRVTQVWEEDDHSVLTEDTANKLLDYLDMACATGYNLVGWNSTKFDWRVLSLLTDRATLCRKLCLKSYDPAFQVLCWAGYAIGQDATCKGMGLPGKPGHEMGKMAALMWAAGDYEPVIQYCMSDAQQLGQIYDMGYRYRKIKWVTNKGDTSCFPLPLGWLSVAQCLKLAEPDTSWMEKPWDRKEGLEWLLK